MDLFLCRTAAGVAIREAITATDGERVVDEQASGILRDGPTRSLRWPQHVSRQEMQQAIIGYHQDDQGDWVADLVCGHGQHVRHQPPFTNRPWVLTVAGREQYLGTLLNCKKCEEPTPDPSSTSR